MVQASSCHRHGGYGRRRAFERVGGLQYLTEIAMGLFAKGDMASFVPLYRTITRGGSDAPTAAHAPAQADLFFDYENWLGTISHIRWI
jgi:hypothetical protein